jgi:AcrR family transcriptional regulator
VDSTPDLEVGLRERKKERTRRIIAEAAAALFAERGYEQVAIIDVARAAEVAEQTVYNYFPTKERLVLDLDEVLKDRLVSLIRSRPSGVSPAAAIRPEALAMVEGTACMDPEQLRGGLGSLATISPTVHRLSLEMTNRHADAVTSALVDTTSLVGERAKLHAVALVWVFQTITERTGQLTRNGRSPAAIARHLRPVVEAMLDELELWPVEGDTPVKRGRPRGQRQT